VALCYIALAPSPGVPLRNDPVDSALFYLQGLACLHLKHRVARSQVTWLLDYSPLVHFDSGSVVFRQGEQADTAIYLIRGLLGARVSTPDGEREVGTAGAWDVIGETALYAPDQPRSATVRTLLAATGIRLTLDLLGAGRHNPVIAAIEYQLLHTLTHRIRATNHAIGDTLRQHRLSEQEVLSGSRTSPSHLRRPSIYPRPTSNVKAESTLYRSQAERLLGGHPYLEVDSDHLVETLRSCFPMRLRAGDILCHEGAPSTALYFLLQGTMRVLKKDHRGSPRPIGSVTGPALLGHMGVLDRTRRTATCEASTPALIAAMDPSTIHETVRSTDNRGYALRRLMLSSLTRQLVSGNAHLQALLSMAGPDDTGDDDTLSMLRVRTELMGWSRTPGS